MVTGGISVPVSGSPTSRLFWHPVTCPVWPQAGVGLLPKGSFCHSPTSCDMTAVSSKASGNKPVVSKSRGENVWMGRLTPLLLAPWNPSTQHLFRSVGRPIDITTLYIRKIGNVEGFTPCERSAGSSWLANNCWKLKMLTTPSGQLLPNTLGEIPRPVPGEICTTIGDRVFTGPSVEW